MTTTTAPPPSVASRTVDAGGRSRHYLLVAPAGLRPGAALVLVFHGSNQSAARFRTATGGSFDALSAGGGAVVAYLDGHRGAWNDARTSSDFAARREGVDDVAFTEAVIAELGASLGVDAGRVHAVGFSAGGQMVIRLLHQVPERIAGAAIIAATQPAPGDFDLPTDDPTPRPVLLVHGTKDPITPYAGGMASLWGFRPRGLGRSAVATAEYYAARNGITAAPTTTDLPHQRGPGRTRVTRTDHRSPGEEPVTLLTVHGGGHVVPGSKRFPRVMGRTTRDVDAAAAVADFFGLPTGNGGHPVLRAVARTPGGPEVLVLEQGPHPVPGAGQVVVAMEAAGVAFGDVQRRQGRLPGRFPLVPGYDVVGRVAALGAGVTGLAVGQRVAALAGTGGCATEVLVAADRCVEVPDDLPAARLAALVLNYTTAWQLLHRAARVRPGASILVLGAAGGVGSALTELAALEGITVHGTASPSRHAVLATRGVRVVEDGEHPPAPVDATFDPIGGPSLAASRRVTTTSGVVVSYGASFASTAELSGLRLLTGAVSALARARLTPGPRVVPFTITSSVRKDPGAYRRDLAHLVELLRTGRIDPQVETLLLQEAAEAHRRLEGRRVVGKLVLTHHV